MIPIRNLSEEYYREDLYTRNIDLIGNEEDMILELLSLIYYKCDPFYISDWWASGKYNSKFDFIEDRIRRNEGRFLLNFPDLNYTGKDCYLEDENCYIHRYLYFDGYGRIIDIRNFMEKLESKYWNLKDHVYIPYGDDFRRHKYGKKKKFWTQPYRYRKDPVPNTSSRKRHEFERFPKGIKRILIQSTDPECEIPYRNGALPLKNGLDAWDGRIRENREHASWKNQKKKRQWM